MENKLKFKSASESDIEMPFNSGYPVVMEMLSTSETCTLIVKDPSSAMTTIEFIGGRERRG